MDTIWVGQIPEIFGYGIMVLGHDEKSCRKALRKAYKDWNGQLGFDRAFDNWGGSIQEVEIGKVYYDNFGE